MWAEVHRDRSRCAQQMACLSRDDLLLRRAHRKNAETSLGRCEEGCCRATRLCILEQAHRRLVMDEVDRWESFSETLHRVILAAEDSNPVPWFDDLRE